MRIVKIKNNIGTIINLNADAAKLAVRSGKWKYVNKFQWKKPRRVNASQQTSQSCLLYTSDAADE